MEYFSLAETVNSAELNLASQFFCTALLLA